MVNSKDLSKTTPDYNEAVEAWHLGRNQWEEPTLSLSDEKKGEVIEITFRPAAINAQDTKNIFKGENDYSIVINFGSNIRSLRFGVGPNGVEKTVPEDIRQLNVSLKNVLNQMGAKFKKFPNISQGVFEMVAGDSRRLRTKRKQEYVSQDHELKEKAHPDVPWEGQALKDHVTAAVRESTREAINDLLTE